MNIRITTLGTAALAVLLNLPVQAGNNEVHGNLASATVRLGDLDLTTAGGLSSARDRVQKTAKRLCQKLVSTMILGRQATFQDCVDDAVVSAMQKLGPAAGMVAQVTPGTPGKP